MPVWYKFFEDSGMGMVLCALTTGGHMQQSLLLSGLVAWCQLMLAPPGRTVQE